MFIKFYNKITCTFAIPFECSKNAFLRTIYDVNGGQIGILFWQKYHDRKSDDAMQRKPLCEQKCDRA